MPIFEIGAKRVLFIHIPKTGGSSIVDWLRGKGMSSLYGLIHSNTCRCNPQHFTWADIKFLYPDHLWDFAFTIVRNPYDRLVSEYNWRLQQDNVLNKNLIDFERWLLFLSERLRKDPFVLDNHLRPQGDYLSERLTIFRFEDGLEKIAGEICSKLEITNDFGNRIINMSTPADAVWTHQCYEIANKIYTNDFDILNYPVVRSPLKVRQLCG